MVSRYSEITGLISKRVDLLRRDFIRNICNRATNHTPSVVVRVGPTIVTCRVVRVRQLDGESTSNQGLQALVNSGKRDAGKIPTHGYKDFISSRVDCCVCQVAIHGSTLLSEALSTGFEGFSQPKITRIRLRYHMVLSRYSYCNRIIGPIRKVIWLR